MRPQYEQTALRGQRPLVNDVPHNFALVDVVGAGVRSDGAMALGRELSAEVEQLGGAATGSFATSGIAGSASSAPKNRRRALMLPSLPRVGGEPLSGPGARRLP